MLGHWVPLESENVTQRDICPEQAMTTDHRQVQHRIALDGTAQSLPRLPF